MVNVTYSDKTLNILLKEFQTPRTDYRFQPLTQGFINDTFLVLSDTQPLYILQRINHEVFPNVKELMGNIQKAFEHLKHDSYRTIALVRTGSGSTYFEHEVYGYWRLMTYISGTIAYDTTQDSKIAREAGRLIGTFHLLLQDVDPDDFFDTVPRFHDLHLRNQQFETSLGRARTARLNEAKNAIAFAKDTIKELLGFDRTPLPPRVCHNDTKLNNILFSKQTGEALCLIDLDTLMKGYFHYDFGDAVRTIVNTAAEDEKDHRKIAFENRLFEAFVDGLASNAPFLTKGEIKALPYGVVLMPFLHGLRALTDYLNNDTYYKVAYENQNLDRCLSLFDFTAKALREMDYMAQIALKKLSPKS
ncbi:aminoglycoside phosphotransferase family protein [Flavobacteriaceae bacterium TP-CH-4]|uniref:Aminoglycoside phosphotransferase family protein n=1 Tax=Pelagihabitans pacificus TaxID=2696054 RepID=A0A967E4K6_9FLAO|nr:aminoglycoside phosphotransferase family protein [Pelagihabitans pacificus]NHF58487.1 aminoglycoside phosphotransferase family protein [Pelagihabitans pacificus]